MFIHLIDIKHFQKHKINILVNNMCLTQVNNFHHHLFLIKILNLL